MKHSNINRTGHSQWNTATSIEQVTASETHQSQWNSQWPRGPMKRPATNIKTIPAVPKSWAPWWPVCQAQHGRKVGSRQSRLCDPETHLAENVSVNKQKYYNNHFSRVTHTPVALGQLCSLQAFTKTKWNMYTDQIMNNTNTINMKKQPTWDSAWQIKNLKMHTKTSEHWEIL